MYHESPYHSGDAYFCIKTKISVHHTDPKKMICHICTRMTSSIAHYNMTAPSILHFQSPMYVSSRGGIEVLFHM